MTFKHLPYKYQVPQVYGPSAWAFGNNVDYEFRDWCHQNAKGDWESEVVLSTDKENSFCLVIVMHFSDEEDALLFALSV